MCHFGTALIAGGSQTGAVVSAAVAVEYWRRKQRGRTPGVDDAATQEEPGQDSEPGLAVGDSPGLLGRAMTSPRPKRGQTESLDVGCSVGSGNATPGQICQ